VLPLAPPEVAEIVVLPACTPVARPPLFTVAAVLSLEVQTTESVRIVVVPSE